MPTNTDITPDQNAVAMQRSPSSTVFMITREDCDEEENSLSGPIFDLTIDFVTAESADEVIAYQEEIIESEGFEIDFSGSAIGSATCGSIESTYMVHSMDHPVFWEWIEEHFDECIDNLVDWAKCNVIEAAALLNVVHSGETRGHHLLAQHGQFRSIVERSILQSASEVEGADKPSSGSKCL